MPELSIETECKACYSHNWHSAENIVIIWLVFFHIQDTSMELSTVSTNLHAALVNLGVLTGALFVIALFLLPLIFFILSCLSLLKVIPKEYHTFPRWFCWLFVIPAVGYIFQWIMLPFGIPDAIKRFSTNPEAVKKASLLKAIGICFLIFSILSGIHFLTLLSATVSLVFFIIYWVQVVKVRKMLEATGTSNQSHSCCGNKSK